MTSNFENFKQQIDDSVKLLESSDVVGKSMVELSDSLDNLVDTQSLLARCDSIFETYKSNKPTIRIVHHLACSGGALLAESISAMPNVYLLSELHPYVDCNNAFSSSDILKSTIDAKIPSSKKLSEELFISNIKNIHQHVLQLGGKLVIRDNAYFDYLYSEEITGKSIVSLLESEFNVISVVLYRNAIDTYASLANEEYYKGIKLSFDEFCHRTMSFLNDYSTADVYNYEALRTNDNEIVEKISQSLKIEFNELYDLIKTELHFHQFDTWQSSKFDCYNSKLDTLPSLNVIGKSNNFVELQKRVKPKHPKLILIATLPRSGSTWIFNCVCEAFRVAKEDFYSCWIEDYDPSNQAPTHIVKTHQPEYQLSSQADVIISARRDVRDIIGSLLRMGWLAENKVINSVNHLINTVHPFWFDRSDLEINYPELLSNPDSVIEMVCSCLNFNFNEHELNTIKLYLTNLSDPKVFDIKTQLHPNHRAGKHINYLELVGDHLNNEINEIAAEWLTKFGF